jgi:hypothetical protein
LPNQFSVISPFRVFVVIFFCSMLHALSFVISWQRF